MQLSKKKKEIIAPLVSMSLGGGAGSNSFHYLKSIVTDWKTKE